MNILGIADVTAKGIDFNSQIYSCPEAVSERWYEVAMMTGGWKVIVKYNKVNTSQIHCFDVTNKKWLLCTTVNLHADVDGKINNYFSAIQKLMEIRQQSKSRKTR